MLPPQCPRFSGSLVFQQENRSKRLNSRSIAINLLSWLLEQQNSRIHWPIHYKSNAKFLNSAYRYSNFIPAGPIGLARLMEKIHIGSSHRKTHQGTSMAWSVAHLPVFSLPLAWWTPLFFRWWNFLSNILRCIKNIKNSERYDIFKNNVSQSVACVYIGTPSLQKLQEVGFTATVKPCRIDAQCRKHDHFFSLFEHAQRLISLLLNFR